MASRIALHLDFPDHSEPELMQIARLMHDHLNDRFDAEAEPAFGRHLSLRRAQPHFANARSMRNALDRMRLRNAARLLAAKSALSRDDLYTQTAGDIQASRVVGDAQTKDNA